MSVTKDSTNHTGGERSKQCHCGKIHSKRCVTGKMMLNQIKAALFFRCLTSSLFSGVFSGSAMAVSFTGLFREKIYKRIRSMVRHVIAIPFHYTFVFVEVYRI